MRARPCLNFSVKPSITLKQLATSMPFSDFPNFSIQPALNTDQNQIVNLIGDCYQEYGDQVVLHGDDSDLLDIEGNYRGREGEFIVVRNETGVILPRMPLSHWTNTQNSAPFAASIYIPNYAVLVSEKL